MASAVGPEQRHTRAHRCGVCGGADTDPRDQGKRCSGFTSEDGMWCRCSREEHAGGLIEETMADGGTVYRHLMRGMCRCGVEHGAAQPKDDVEATYDYVDERGRLLYQVLRKTGKRFLQRKPDGAGGWDWKLGDVRRVPYHLPELLAADPDATVYIVEGEKDADNLQRALSIGAVRCVVTCNAGGAGKWHTVQLCAAVALKDRSVVIIADADDAGRRHARQVHDALKVTAKSITMVEPPAPYKDISDVLRAGLALHALIPMTVPVVVEAPPAPKSDPSSAAIKILTGPDLAKPLPDLEYLVREIGLVAGGGAPHMIAGYGFSGKTVAAQSLAVSLAAQAKVWGSFISTEKRRVLHVDMEQGERLTQRRYQRIAFAIGVDLSELGDDIALAVMPPIQLTAAHKSQWMDLMAGRDLIIIDSLRAASSGQDENSSEIRGGLDMLGQVSEDTKCRAMVIHHARKVSADDPGGRYAIRGSGAIFDGSDSVYLFGANKGEPVNVEMVKARSHGEPVDDFAIVIGDVEYEGDPKAGLRIQIHGAELIQEKRDAAAKTRRYLRSVKDAQALREALRKHPQGMGSVELRAATGLSGDRFSSAMAELGDSVESAWLPDGKRTRKVHRLK